jgi:Na+-translocating ferredoxin:NAD+ oxidoreductase RnfD subunit
MPQTSSVAPAPLAPAMPSLNGPLEDISLQNALLESTPLEEVPLETDGPEDAPAAFGADGLNGSANGLAARGTAKPRTVQAAETSASAQDVPAASGMARFALPFDPRYIAPVFITCVLLAGQLSFGVLESYQQTLLAIGASIATEIVLSKLLTGKWPHLASAYVSGISVGILVRSTDFWPYALCSMIAITSKYVIRYKGRHLWNPSNFAIAVMLIIAHDNVATLSIQWDNRLWAMAIIWALGSLIIWNLRRFHICATYIVSFIAFAFLRSVITGHPWQSEISPITGPMYQLFIFFMITDPKTTVKTKRGQCIVAFAVAAMENVLRLAHNTHAPYYALFLVGPVANLLEIWWNAHRPTAAPSGSSTSETAPVFAAGAR